MSDPLSAAERYRNDGLKFSELAKSSANPFVREYYGRVAQRYLLYAENVGAAIQPPEGNRVETADRPVPYRSGSS
jgi:hypothetical protein